MERIYDGVAEMIGALKLKHKIYTGFLAVGLIGTAIAVLSYISFDNISTSFRAFVGSSSQAQQQMQLARNVSEIQRQALIYTYEGHPSAAEQVHTIYQSMSQALEKDNKREIRQHLKAYMKAFSQLQTQKVLQHQLIHQGLSQAASHAADYFQTDNSALTDRDRLENERILNSLLLIQNHAMRYFDSLNPQYIRQVKEEFALVRKKIKHLENQTMQPSITLKSTAINHQLNEYEHIFLESVQRTRGYLFLVNVVMSAEAYEILYNSKKMAKHAQQEMATIEQTTAVMLEQAITSIVTAIIISLCLIILFSLLIARSLTRPIVQLTGAFKALAQGEHLTHIPTYNVDDEIGALTRAAAVFKERNRQTETLLEQAKVLTDDLSESKRRFQLLVDAFMLIEPNGSIIDVNAEACESLNYSRDEILKLNLADVDVSFSAQEIKRIFAQTKQGEVVTIEGVNRRKDGSTFPVEMRMGKLEQHGDLFAMVLVRDLSTRKQTEEKVRMLSQAMEQSGEAVVITDAKAKIEYVNPAFSTISGYSEAEALGQSPSILNSGKQDASFYANMWSALSAGEFWQGKVINTNKNGVDYPAMLTISPIKNIHGEITNYIGIQQSLTEIEKLEDQFRQAQKMEALGTLVGGIAHDFNNTLAGITGNLYLAKKAVEAMPKVSNYLQTIETLSFRAAATIQQLMAFSRKSTVQMQPLAIATFLKETVKLQQVSLPENISMKLQITDNDMQIKGDVNQLQQVLINLMNNARDAIEESANNNPTIQVHLDHFLADDAFATSHDDLCSGEYARISVIDNGAGIKPENIDHLLEPFFTTKEQGKGTGLGLAMAYGTIKTHAGAIEIKAAEHTGTIVEIYLPLIVVNKSNNINTLKHPILIGHGETILLVDDNNMVLATGQALLKELDYKVIVASDGVEAIKVYQTHKDDIDLLILDVVMPKLGGAEALQAIRKINPEVKAMFATGYDKFSMLDKIDEALQEKVISKPFTVSKLSQLIRDILDET
ncbi:MAG: PAS domain S-box protein [Mariprofundus sp.]|nr:PAS domain S-box protein [Mariprofundus sp.]